MKPADPPRLRIMIVDDHPMLRTGVGDIINATPDLTVVAEAGAPAEAIALASTTRPDVVLLDLHLRESSGLGLVAHLRRILPGVRILVFTGHLTEAEVRQAAAASVDGYVLKTCAAGELMAIIRRVAAGATHWEGDTARLLVAASQQPAPSPREIEVLRLLAAGRTNKQIAAELALSINTVVEYVLSVRNKLGAQNRAEAVHIALQRGLL